MEILKYALIFGSGVVVGYIVRQILVRINSDGAIVVSTDEETDKTLYSLELDNVAETLASKKQVVFKVVRKRNIDYNETT